MKSILCLSATSFPKPLGASNLLSSLEDCSSVDKEITSGRLSWNSRNYLFFCAYQALFVESIYRFVVFRFIELRSVHMCRRYYRRSDKQRIGEAFKLGTLPQDLIFPDWNDNFLRTPRIVAEMSLFGVTNA
jgi:hypothetical protein